MKKSETAVAPTEILRGSIERVYAERGDWMAGVLRLADRSTARFAGAVCASLGEYVALQGHWAEDKKYGRGFKVTGMLVDLDLDPAGLVAYLSNHPELRGIGPQRAALLVNKFGVEEFERVLLDAPGRMSETTRIPLDVIHNLRELWISARDSNATFAALSGYGLSYRQAKRLVEKFGSGAVARFDIDPYRLVDEVPALGFKRIDDVARAMGKVGELDEVRLRAGLKHLLKRAMQREGHTWTEYMDLIREANVYLQFDSLDAKSRLEAAIDSAVTANEITLVADGSVWCLALPSVAWSEAYITRTLREAITLPAPMSVIEACTRVANGASGLTLNPSQTAAVQTALASRVSVICGPAGTGKTTIIGAVCAAVEDAGLTVALAAFAGKAAKRMQEVVGRPASTIHRMLGWQGFAFARNERSPLEADVVVVDEASMIDVPLARALLTAIDFRRTSLVLVGDPHQLPPVGAGSVFRDVIATGLVPICKLDRVIRQAGTLKDNATDILAGVVQPTAAAAPGELPPWVNETKLRDAREIVETIARVYEHRLTPFGLDPVTDVQVLTPWNKGTVGTAALNARIQEVVQRVYFGRDLTGVPVHVRRRQRFFPGDKVIQTRNDYNAGVMNGETGRVLDVADGKVTIAFDETKVVAVEIGTSEFDDLELAYALTIHKAQGSQYPLVIAVIHKSNLISLNRELLYTAATRAETSFVALGDGWSAREAAKRTGGTKRRTLVGLSDDLLRPCLETVARREVANA